jgi:hypothetical protein
MADSFHDLAGELALAACQVLELGKAAAQLPPLSDASADPNVAGRLGVVGYIHPAQPDAEGKWVELGQDGQIDALRVWAAFLGADLHLSEAREASYPAGHHVRTLETTGELPGGLRVRIYTMLDYDPADPAYAGGYVPADAEPATT